MAKRAIKAVVVKEPLRLDLGCGKNKQKGFVGIDSIQFEGVDQVLNLVERVAPGNAGEFVGWPWEDGSVEQVHCSHFLEHLEPRERIHFANELCRVLRKGGTANLATPYSGHDCAYGDPTHKWPPVSGWTYLYWNKEWRKAQAPHVDIENNPAGLSCDFDYTIGGSWEQWLQTRNMEYRVFAMQHYLNSQRDIVVTLTKK